MVTCVTAELNSYFQVTFAPSLCIDSVGVQFIELDPRKPNDSDKKVRHLATANHA